MRITTDDGLPDAKGGTLRASALAPSDSEPKAAATAVENCFIG